MALHEQCVGKTDEWYTPPHIFRALDCVFDLDVAHPGTIDWVPCAGYLTHDSLARDWIGFVWMNPPFGGRNALYPWLEKFAQHGNGIALVPDRTSAPWWQWIASRAERLLFISPKIRFIGSDGKPGKSPAQGTTLLSIGLRGNEALCRAAAFGLGFLAQPRSMEQR